MSQNAARRHHLLGALSERGIPAVESHTNFILFEAGGRADELIAAMTASGVLIRGMQPGWVRVSVGDDEDNRRFIEALDNARSAQLAG